jgi:hypothetical protein
LRLRDVGKHRLGVGRPTGGPYARSSSAGALDILTSMDHNFEQLKAHILPLSQAKTFDAARREWVLIGVEVSEEFDNCPCGQEIKEHCYIKNALNGNTTYVGNVCINRFIGIDTGNLFEGIKRIVQNASANANEDLIEHAYRFGYIYESEYKFLMDTRRKRNLSEKQLAWKQKINRRITNRIVVRKRSNGLPPSL